MHRLNAAAGLLGLCGFAVLLYGISTSHMSEYTLSSTRFGTSGVEYSAGIWMKRYASEFYRETNEAYCHGNDTDSMCTGVRAMRAAAVMAVILAFLASVTALVAEHLHLGAGRSNMGKIVAVTMFVLAGFWAMVAFAIWRESVQDDIEERLLQCLDYSFDQASVRIGTSGVLVVSGWLLCWAAAGVAALIPRFRRNRRRTRRGRSVGSTGSSNKIVPASPGEPRSVRRGERRGDH